MLSVQSFQQFHCFMLLRHHIPDVFSLSKGKTNNSVVLVPFAEYIPYEKLIKRSDFIMAHLPSPIAHDNSDDCFHDGIACFAPLICFEALFSNYITYLCRKGAEVFFVSSSNLLINSKHIERISQKIIVMNSLISKRSFVRSSENGISSVVSYNDSVVAESSVNEEMINRSICLNDKITFYVSHDVIIDYTYYVLTLLILFLIALKQHLYKFSISFIF